MSVHVDRLVARYMDRWVYLLGLGAWRITHEVADGPLNHEEDMAHAEYRVKRSGYRKANIRFDRAQMTSGPTIERAVVHELLHIYDHGIGNDAHKLIYKLERPLIRVRRRLSRSK